MTRQRRTANGREEAGQGRRRRKGDGCLSATMGRRSGAPWGGWSWARRPRQHPGCEDGVSQAESVRCLRRSLSSVGTRSRDKAMAWHGAGAGVPMEAAGEGVRKHKACRKRRTAPIETHKHPERPPEAHYHTKAARMLVRVRRRQSGVATTKSRCELRGVFVDESFESRRQRLRRTWRRLPSVRAPKVVPRKAARRLDHGGRTVVGLATAGSAARRQAIGAGHDIVKYKGEAFRAFRA